MALETDSLNKRTLGPAVGSTVVGIALGVCLDFYYFLWRGLLPKFGARILRH